MEILAVAADDHDAWLHLWQGYQRFYATEIPEATTALTWQRFLAADEPMHAALAWQDGRAIGMVHWIFHRSCWTEGNYCYLQDLFVDEQVRGSGIGRALIEHVYAQARQAGASRVHWLTHESNTTAMQLYDRIAERPGFVQYRKKL
ncbi:N-acetyltransferase [Pseudomonas straminea]|uniref:Acetyltransferase (GNAT) family protein n=1 Tax=Pseudomonas straminea TaxID=47882 RepID=A0A1I1SZS5_PSEOC|nr:GNAT family N-acetyltransferase [Pseudomonas straminea]GLX12722.1 N-acetyltransferase [Pseudomonas straminea]SFD51955.1 Acetyltransferase (GNAT) family protein [Pseudomonas straminea]